MLDFEGRANAKLRRRFGEDLEEKERDLGVTSLGELHVLYFAVTLQPFSCYSFQPHFINICSFVCCTLLLLLAQLSLHFILLPFVQLSFHLLLLRPTRNTGILPKTVNHSASADDEPVPRKRNTAPECTATTFVDVHIRETRTKTAYDDGYSWRKCGQKAVAGYEYPREFFRCKHHRSEGCPARKQVQRLDEDPPLFKVIHLLRHTCTQFSHLYTGQALYTSEEDSDYPVFSGNIEAALMWAVARLDGYSWIKYARTVIFGFKYPTICENFCCPHIKSEGCLARKCVKKWDRGCTRFMVIHLGKHTCKQSSRLAASAAVEPTEAASDDQEVWRKIETALMRTAPVADGYSWIKDQQTDISSKHPREYYRCIDHLSQRCPATKGVQISRDDPSILKVTYNGRHTCKQSSHLATDAAVEPTKDASDDKDVSRNTNTAPKWTATTYVDEYSWEKYDQKAAAGSKCIREYYRCTHHDSQGCMALKHVQRSDEDSTSFEVTYRGRHICEQSSHLATAAAVEPTEGASQEKDISKQLENLLNPSSTTEAQLLSGEEILCSHAKELPTGNPSVLSEAFTHSAASDNRDVPRKRNTEPKWTSTTYVDRYIWIKCAQKAVPGSKYPREYFRCTHSISQGCLATKQVQRSDEDPRLFVVTYSGERHTCKQSSHLATAAAVEPTGAASDDKDVSGKMETALMWTVAHRDGYSWRKDRQKDILGFKYPREHCRFTHRDSQGCLATKRVQRLNNGPSIFEVTHRRRHTCEQSSSHLPQPIEAESEVKPEKSEVC
ncbi:hypothetical protein SLEP1_g9898 [Rubroshorea leprosula]|uniref:WRKY domain-containing protein n=1 Tax=Rubroshorea leprosula TaxID=152421 RepID=A0AAV5IFM5_9ROSI|nr:hypothetical protein SLEP1_g9898 [Rubroshorea leprosula]